MDSRQASREGPGRPSAEQAVTVVIPCLDEADALPGVLAAVPETYQVVVVDNGSTDHTADVARSRGARVVFEPVPGYGSAVQAGVVAARTGIVAVLDGDGSLDPAELPLLVAELRDGADLVVGRRRPIGSGAWPLHARAADAFVAWRLRRVFGLPVHDIGPVRVAGRDRLLALGACDTRYGYPLEVLVRASRGGWRVVERDVSYRARRGGRSKVSGSLRGSLSAAHDFVRVLR